MSAVTITSPSETSSYFEKALEAIVQQPQYSWTQHQDAKDCLTYMRHASNRKQETDKTASKSRLIQKNPDIPAAAGEQLYTPYHARKMAARTLSRAATQAEQSILDKHGVDYQTAYRLSGAPHEEGIANGSTFASKKDDKYRLLRFDGLGGCEEKAIKELGLRSRFGLVVGQKESDARRKVCGTSCSKIDSVTAWIQHQSDDLYTAHQPDIGSIQKYDADVRGVLSLSSSVGGVQVLKAKKRLWDSKYNHPKLRGAYPHQPKHGAMEMLCGRFAAETVLSREPESDTVRNLKSRYTDLSPAILLDCMVNENGSFEEKDLSIARSSFFFPADPETSQSMDPFDQFYDLVSIDNGELSVEEHTVGEMVGKLRIGDKSTKSGSSKRRGKESDQADEESSKRPRVVG